MIVSLNPEPHREEFDKLLNLSMNELNAQVSKSSAYLETLAGRSLEPHIKDVMSETARGTAFEGSIELISGQKFPDIVANKYYGIEVKTTTQNHWKTTGNSVMENTRVGDVERIFMLFAKLAKPIEFRIRPYEEVLSEVVVTHSPRYLIDMNLEKGKTIFDKINIPYDTLRKKDNPIRPIVDYYRSKLKPGEELWWMDTKSDIGGIRMQFWSNVPTHKQEYLRRKSMVLFPEIFGKSQDKYSRIAFWLLSTENIVCPNVRDNFSAGGRTSLLIGNKTYQNVPRIYANLFNQIKEIINILDETPYETLSEYWSIRTTNAKKLNDWIKLVSTHSKNFSAANHLNIEKMINESLMS